MVDTSDDGASPKELLFASCRQNNVELLHEALSHLTTPTAIGDFINKSLDPLGNTALHVASRRGCLDSLDVLLDQEGVEVDPRNRMEGDTPLHAAARISADENDETTATDIIEMLLDAGADPRVRNKGGLKPVDVVSPQHKDLREILKKAELKYVLGKDVVAEDDEDDEGYSASDED